MLKAGRHFEKVLLRILDELTSIERSKLCFYCRKDSPEPPNQEEMQQLFRELQYRNMISSSNVSFLIEFTNTIRRYDLTNILLEYELEVEVGTILQEYAVFRDENPNFDCPEMSSTQIISKHLSRKCRNYSEQLTNIAVKLSRDTSFQDVIRISIDKILSREGKLCWSSILQILGFSSELAYRRMCLFPGPSKLDIDDVRLVLKEFKIVSWMAQNGGAAGCAKFITNQDPIEIARQEEIKGLVAHIICQDDGKTN